MGVMENNVVHEGSMQMSGIPEEWVFYFMIHIIITTWDDYHLKFLDSKKPIHIKLKFSTATS